MLHYIICCADLCLIPSYQRINQGSARLRVLQTIWYSARAQRGTTRIQAPQGIGETHQNWKPRGFNTFGGYWMPEPMPSTVRHCNLFSRRVDLSFWRPRCHLRRSRHLRLCINLQQRSYQKIGETWTTWKYASKHSWSCPAIRCRLNPQTLSGYTGRFHPFCPVRANILPA